MIDKLTARQKQVLAGGMLIALGVVSGVVIAPDDPQRDDKLADLGSALGSAVAAHGRPVDVSEYHRAVAAVRAGRKDLVDVLSADVASGESVTTQVNVALGARPASFDLTGLADGRFDLVPSLACPTCGLSFVDADEHTTLIVTANNTSSETLRLTGFIYCVVECVD